MNWIISFVMKFHHDIVLRLSYDFSFYAMTECMNNFSMSIVHHQIITIYNYVISSRCKGRILTDFVNRQADHTTVQATVFNETEHSHPPKTETEIDAIFAIGRAKEVAVRSLGAPKQLLQQEQLHLTPNVQDCKYVLLY